MHCTCENIQHVEHSVQSRSDIYPTLNSSAHNGPAQDFLLWSGFLRQGTQLLTSFFLPKKFYLSSVPVVSIYQHLTSAQLAMIRTKFDLKDILENRFSVFEHISMLVIFVDTVLRARALANFNWI